jgi:hypothetical protein
VSKTENLRSAGGLAGSEMTEQKKPTEEVFHAYNVSLNSRVVLRRLVPMIHAEKLGMKLTLRDHLIKDSSLFRRQDFLVPRVAKKVSLVTGVGRVISKISGVEKGHDRSAVFVGVKEQEVFELRLKKLDLHSDKLAKIVHA